MESLSIVLQRSPWPPAFGQPLHPFVSVVKHTMLPDNNLA